MALFKKFIITIIITVMFGSCSHIISMFDLASVCENKNRGKEGNLVLLVSIPNDTLYASGDHYLKVKAILKYTGDNYYYFKLSPLTWRMDWVTADANSFLRTFYYNNEKCRVSMDLKLYDEQRYSNYLLRPQKCLTFECPLDLTRLISPSTNSTEYGEYHMDMYYITDFQDTIRSNKVTFWYFEN